MPRFVRGHLPGRTRARAIRRRSPATFGAGEVFDEAIGRFAVAYANQTERDHAGLVEAIRAGRIPAETGV